MGQGMELQDTPPPFVATEKGFLFPANIAIDQGSGNCNNRNYCFTDWAPERKWEDFDWGKIGARYAVGQFEVDPQTNSRIFQGYVELNSPKRYTALKKSWPGNVNSVWFGARKGTATLARSYCMKLETRANGTEAEPCGPFEFGVFTDTTKNRKTFKRMDSEVKDIKKMMLQDGLTRYDIVERHPNYANKHRRLLERLEKIAAKKLRHNSPPRRCKVLVIQGDSGGGKSSTIHSLVARADLYQVSNDNGGYCCDYEGQKVILFDNLDRKTLNLAKFKQLTDRYQQLGTEEETQIRSSICVRAVGPDYKLFFSRNLAFSQEEPE